MGNYFSASDFDGLLNSQLAVYNRRQKVAARGRGWIDSDNEEAVKRKIADETVRLILEIYHTIHAVIPSFPLEAIGNDAKTVIARGVSKTKSVTVHIWFRREFLWRDSLCQNVDAAYTWRNYSIRQGKYGTDDIVMQFERGWHTYGTVSGMWHGRKTVSKTYQKPRRMIKNAVKKFNAQQGSTIRAVVDERYR